MEWRPGRDRKNLVRFRASLPTLFGEGDYAPREAMKIESQQLLPLGDVLLPKVDASKQLIDEVVNRFDFQSVQTAMKALGWTYFNEVEVPSLETLRTKARELLEGAAMENEDGVEHQSGGFRATWYSPGTVVLSFVVAFGHATKVQTVRLPNVKSAL